MKMDSAGVPPRPTALSESGVRWRMSRPHVHTHAQHTKACTETHTRHTHTTHTQSPSHTHGTLRHTHTPPESEARGLGPTTGEALLREGIPRDVDFRCSSPKGRSCR